MPFPGELKQGDLRGEESELEGVGGCFEPLASEPHAGDPHDDDPLGLTQTYLLLVQCPSWIPEIYLTDDLQRWQTYGHCWTGLVADLYYQIFLPSV